MADELLSAVIQLENQIHRQLQQEQLRADSWLVGVRADLEKQSQQELQQLIAENENKRAAAELNAKTLATAIEAKEKEYCANLEEISDQVLLEVLGRQLQRLLPGQIDDHKNVES